MGVARRCVNITVGVRALWASTRSGTENLESAALVTARARRITFSPRGESAKAHLWAVLGVALLGHLFKLSMRAVLASILGLHGLDEPCSLHTTTTLLAAARPLGKVTTAVHRARGGVRACLGVACLVAMGAFLATMFCMLCDVVDALHNTIATRGGAIAELCPMTFAILWAAFIVAGLFVDLTIFVWALRSTTHSRLVDVEDTDLLANFTIATAICALFAALTKAAP